MRQKCKLFKSRLISVAFFLPDAQRGTGHVRSYKKQIRGCSLVVSSGDLVHFEQGATLTNRLVQTTGLVRGSGRVAIGSRPTIGIANATGNERGEP
jgi:hypothetical protein